MSNNNNNLFDLCRVNVLGPSPFHVIHSPANYLFQLSVALEE